MEKRTWYKFIILLLLAGLTLVACGGGQEETPAATTETTAATEETTAEEPTSEPVAEEPVGEKVTIRLSTWAGVEEAAELQAILDEINANETRFQIVHEPAPADYYTKIQTSLAGDTSADLFWLSQEHIAGYAQQGALLDVTDCLAASDNPAADLDDYFPEILKTAQLAGRTYGLPWIAQPVVLFYNTALFDEAGLDYPTA